MTLAILQLGFGVEHFKLAVEVGSPIFLLREGYRSLQLGSVRDEHLAGGLHFLLCSGHSRVWHALLQSHTDLHEQLIVAGLLYTSHIHSIETV